MGHEVSTGLGRECPMSNVYMVVLLVYLCQMYGEMRMLPNKALWDVCVEFVLV
jgi:hypothetical protein